MTSRIPSPRPDAAAREDQLNFIAGGVSIVVLAVIAVAAIGGDVPIADAGTTNLLVVFLTGLVSGGLTCLAVQGGLLATAVAQQQPGGAATLRGQAGPIALFLAAKLAAYTALGALLGAVGSVAGLSPSWQGWLQIAVGLYMLGVAGQLLNLHPVFRYFSLQPPKPVQRWLRREARSGQSLTPAFLGAMTIFVPCGTTQAMLIAAVGTGSAAGGALLLFAFVLGTSPLFFALGYLATRLGSAMQGVFSRLAAAAVALMAIFSVYTGLALAGLPDLQSAAAPVPASSSAVAAAPPSPASAEAGAGAVQEVVVQAAPTFYMPARVQVKAGAPARLKVQTGRTIGCTSTFTIPSLGLRKFVPPSSEVVIDIPTDRARVIPFVCGMGMYRGVIEVTS